MDRRGELLPSLYSHQNSKDPFSLEDISAADDYAEVATFYICYHCKYSTALSVRHEWRRGGTYC